jgi:small-conductance mechanosensitive channel
MAQPVVPTRPPWTIETLAAGGAPHWLLAALVIGLGALAGVLVYSLLARLVDRALSGRRKSWRRFLSRTQMAGRVALGLTGVVMVAPAAALGPGGTALLRHTILVVVIGLLGWVALVAVDVGIAAYMRRFRSDAPDSLIARKHLTQLRFLRQAATVLVVLVAAGLALMTIPQVRQWGVSLLAAGGAAGVLVGLSLQPLVTNLLAGVQIATTQPIRINDVVQVEGEVGTVEEINATYVVVRIWDDRRLVLPLSRFLQEPFQNWTRQSTALIGAVMLYLDYRTPIAAIRAKAEETVRNSAHWDGRTCAVQVTDARETSMEMRILLSAADSGKLFDLRCEVREKLIDYLQDEHPDALPRQRIEFDPALERALGGQANGAPEPQRRQ